MGLSKNDFRLGNLVLIKGKVTEIVAIDEKGINGHNYAGDIMYDFEFAPEYPSSSYGPLEGIDITPDILRNSGFKEMLDGERGIGVFVNDIYDFEETFSGSGNYSLAIHEEYTKTQIRYVHQLQKLWHSLTGEEPEIKL